MTLRIRRGQLILPSVRIVVTGTSDVQVAFRNRLLVDKELDKYRKKYKRALWITGACVGIDEQVALYLHSYGETVYTVVPADKDHIDPRYRQHCSVYEIMPKSCGNTKSERYMARNQRMVDIAVWNPSTTFGSLDEELLTFCLAFPDELRTNRSGTWACVRCAERAGIEIIDRVLVK